VLPLSLALVLLVIVLAVLASCAGGSPHGRQQRRR
jgi:hypothetical protein